MAGFMTDNVTAALIANGDVPAKGYLSVGDVTGFVIGATVSLRGVTVASATYEIVAINATTNTIGVKAVYSGTPGLNGQNYGLTSVSQYTTADTAKIIQPAQFIYSTSSS